MQTEGTLLGGRLRYRQPAQGYRTGIEPVILAAYIPARAGDRVLEAGCGAGAGLLCLLHRVPGATGVGVERDPDMAALARGNMALNGMTAEIMQADITAIKTAPFDHAFANPPWHDAAGTPSPIKAFAKRAGPGLLAEWLLALRRLVRARGTVTVLIPAAQFGRAAAAARKAGLGGLVLVPLWPRAGRPAKLIILQGTAGSRAADRVEPGLLLHEAQGFTPAAQALLAPGNSGSPNTSY